MTEDNRNLIREWYAVQDPEVRAEFDATLLILGAISDWQDPGVEEFKALSKKHAGLGEIRFYVDTMAVGARRPHRRRFRPVGIWPPIDREFILLIGCEKSGRSYIPHDAFDTALQHRDDLRAGKGTTIEHL